MKRLLSVAALVVALVPAAAMHAQSPNSAEVLSQDELKLIKAAENARIRAIESVYGSVVAIYGNDRGGGGSGVLYDSSGLALTNHHVVAGAGTEGWAGLADGKLYRWRLIGTDPGGDVAIIQLLGKDSFPVAPLGNSDRVRVGDFSMAMGNPFVLAEDQRPTVTLGIVSGIERFQEGAGSNTLVYGNCIQVDSSINPGNSGGPLFSIHGDVIGINGRGSFKERGRVNVGLGYAISINQVKNFLPDLLATKMAQHGTLDAIFGNRAGEVICHTINLDSPLAKAGVQLGDKLLAFEGQKINSANHFTNLVSTYPAGWPCAVTFEHEGKVATVHVRLIALPYAAEPEPMPMPKPEEKKPEEKKPDDKKPAEKPTESKPADEAKPADPKPAGDAPKPAEPKPAEAEKPAEKPMPKPIPMPMRPRPNFGKAGEVRDVKLNQENAQRIITRWQQTLGQPEGQAVVGWVIKDDIFRGEEAVGKQTLSIARDGRFQTEVVLDGKTTRHGFDGKVAWSQGADGEVATVDAERLCRNPFAAQGLTLASMFTSKPLSAIGPITIDAGDKAQQRLAYRLKATDSDSDEFFLWLSVLDDAGQPHVQLLKTSESYDEERTLGVLYEAWKPVGGVQLPHERRVVAGLGEAVGLKIVAQSITPASSFDEPLFQKPNDATSK